MSVLKGIERELIAADERLANAPVGVTPQQGQSAESGLLRRRWRRLRRRGRISSVAAGGLMLVAVATGSAQVAGLDPWGKLVGQDRIDPALRPSTNADGSLAVRVADTAGRPGWELRAYVTRDGRLCVVAAGKGGEGLYECRTSDHAAAVLAGRPKSGPPLAGVTQTGAPSMQPRRLVAWALTDWSSPQPRFVVPKGSTVRLEIVDRPLRIDVDRSPAGLSARGRAFVATLPPQLTLRLTVAEISRASRPFSGDTIVAPVTGATADVATTVQITSASEWNRAHRQPWGATDDGTLDRRDPVAGATAQQLRSFPVLARPRRPGDEIPARDVTQELRLSRVATSESRRLSVTGQGDVGPLWIAPGALPTDFTVPSADGQVCLAGTPVLSGCRATSATGSAPEPETVVCAPGLPPDRTLVWSYVPAGATRVHIDYDDAPSTTYPAADLLALVRPRTAPHPTRLRWAGPRGFRQTSKVVLPAHARTAICGKGQAPHYWDLRASSTSSGEAHR